VNAFEAALKKHGAKGAIVASMPENLSEAHAADLMRRGIAPLLGMDEALAAADAALEIGRAWEREVGAQVLAAANTSSTPLLITEAEAKTRLRDSGLPVPEGRVVRSVEEAVAAALELGSPVAAKALGVAHKSEAGAVRLGLRTQEDVRRAAAELLTLSGRLDVDLPGEKGVQGPALLIERMIAHPAAELIIGITSDPIFGPVMTVGSGGVLVELLADTAAVLLPASGADIRAALKSLNLYPLLDGYRGRPVADIEAAVAVIAGIARFAEENAHAIEEMDINPLIVCENGHGAWIADALIVERTGHE
jgi:acyl-CoA synthetase (NDP forming)